MLHILLNKRYFAFYSEKSHCTSLRGHGQQ